jgi:hypothetical protein
VVDFRVGERRESGLHLVQLIRRGGLRDVEILVVYPADGYWRVKPLPPPTLPDTAYGSSFLFGPIEEEGRPFVAIREIAFEPEHLRFRLAFADGRRGTLAIVAATPSGTALELSVDPPLGAGQPFAALRSMYVAERQADVAVAAWRDDPHRSPASAAVLDFARFSASSARFGRLEQSHHNLSAPDLVFEGFRRMDLQ